MVDKIDGREELFGRVPMRDDDPVRQKPIYPAHSWGLLAKDPWMEIGPPMTNTRREVLRRYWLRNGGEETLFDRLVPPVEILSPPPPDSRTPK